MKIIIRFSVLMLCILLASCRSKKEVVSTTTTVSDNTTIGVPPSQGNKQPADAKQQGMDGMVLIQFVVEKDGSLSNFKVSRSSKLPSLDAEALRVAKTLPKFTPGRNEKGQTVRVKYSIPVRFKL